jgi:hypothetical protein
MLTGFWAAVLCHRHPIIAKITIDFKDMAIILLGSDAKV